MYKIDGGIKMNKEELHDFRKKIDGCIQKIPRIDVHGGHPIYGRELNIARIKLQEAKMWVGKCLEQLGSELPKEFRDKAE